MKRTSKLLSAVLTLVMVLALAAPAYAASDAPRTTLWDSLGTTAEIEADAVVAEGYVDRIYVGGESFDRDRNIYTVKTGCTLTVAVEYAPGVPAMYGAKKISDEDYEYSYERTVKFTTDDEQVWEIKLSPEHVGTWAVYGGEYVLFMLDVVEGDGAAPSTPAQPEQPAQPVPADAATYTVQKGDTLSDIATNFYGTNAQRYALYDANLAAFTQTNGRLVEGMVLVIPAELNGETRIPAPVAGEGETLYTVKYGDTLGKIAAAYYGDAGKYQAIYERNADRLESAAMIYAGQVIVLPAKDQQSDASQQPGESVQPGTYTVKSGDSLSKIALAVYGDAAKWSVIYEANKAVIANPSQIYVGQVLTVPAQ